MKLAIVTDIHEDFRSLEIAIRILKKNGYDLLLCLGDITGFAPEYYAHSPDANACIDMLREEADIALAGNHDLFTCNRLSFLQLEKKLPNNWHDLSLTEKKSISNNDFWLYETEILPELSKENFGYLSGLKEFHILEDGNVNILLSHFVKPDLEGSGTWIPHRISQMKPHFRFMKEYHCALAFTGHFHPDGITIAGWFFHNYPASKPIRIKRQPSIVLCPALSGKENSGTCIIFDTATNEIFPVSLG